MMFVNQFQCDDSIIHPLEKDKLEDFKLLFVHVYHLVNEYQPHQARETLRVMMEVQKFIEMIQNCLASSSDDLPHSEAGMNVKTEPMDADDRKNCHKKDQIIEKNAAWCVLIDEMNERP
ncbi:unnamed protein product [Nyctereutes procyonoides]|uniref:Mediator of RNA polymerase II transcription subunit 7 n=1 Tax=Nyctereutes procyonoides TaxID=34880 RepID=A0A811ZZF1_NYCPR|nr:unnamed protein product [Nyctereutes procyonoides]